VGPYYYRPVIVPWGRGATAKLPKSYVAGGRLLLLPERSLSEVGDAGLTHYVAEERCGTSLASCHLGTVGAWYGGDQP